MVLLGVAGTGKSSVAAHLARRTGWPVIETEEEAQRALGTTLSQAFVNRPNEAEKATERAAQDVLDRLVRDTGPAIVVLTPSAAGQEATLGRLSRLKDRGALIVALDAPTDLLARRNGLTAALPASLGTPRAWFRAQHERLRNRYALVHPLWIDTQDLSSDVAAATIFEALGDVEGMPRSSSKLDLPPDTD